MQKSEFAPAKINLTLEILGRRPDAYHELRSLVAFAQDVGDVLMLTTGSAAGVETTGPFADAIVGSNLVDKAVTAFSSRIAIAPAASISLQKNLPVASGIGGGSADAAAALRLLASAYPEVSDDDLGRMAQELGADVSVCLKSRGTMMTGTGERLVEIALPDDLYAVLVNPLVSVPPNKTSQVFAKLGAAALTGVPRAEEPPRLSSARDVIAYAEARGNDLESPARSLLPAIDVVLSELRRLDGNRLSRLSGAGPTCFGVFESESAAHAAAAALQRRRPDWWIRPTRLA
jgi:4-diphosphocytidyl-2-C-methyl-D-erythritol kinase